MFARPSPFRRSQYMKLAIALASPLLIWAGSSAARAISAVAYTVQVVPSKLDAERFVKDSINRVHELKELHDITLDVLCSRRVDPTNRRCKQP